MNFEISSELSCFNEQISRTLNKCLKQLTDWISGQYESTHCKYKGCAHLGSAVCPMFLVQGQLIPGSGRSLVGLGASVLADPETRWQDILPQLQTRNSQWMVAHHHLDPQVTGESHMLHLFKTWCTYIWMKSNCEKKVSNRDRMLDWCLMQI